MQGARYHARQVHGYTEDNGANNAVSFDLTAVVPGQVAPLIQSGAPSKYAKFVVSLKKFEKKTRFFLLENLIRRNLLFRGLNFLHIFALDLNLALIQT